MTSGLLIPFYTYPGALWDQLIALKKTHPSVSVIAVPGIADSGPGSSIILDYVDQIRIAQLAGLKIMGYVDTAYASRSSVDARVDAAHWISWYGVDGIFWDQVPPSGAQLYYNSLISGVKPRLSVGNAGSQSSVLGFDILIEYENVGLGGIPPGVNYLAYGVPTLSTGYPLRPWFYITNDLGGNPWDTLPPYIGQLFADLDTGGAAPPPTPAPSQTFTLTTPDGKSYSWVVGL